MTDNYTVVGLFKDNSSAECAFDAVVDNGYDKDEVDVMMSDETRDRYYGDADADDTELGSKAAEGTGAGAAIGGTVGAVLAAIAAIGTSVVLPGIGLVVAGPIAAALVGGGAGGLAGGLIGALIGSGIPEEHAEIYETGVKSGGIVLRATPNSAEDARDIESKWTKCGGQNIYTDATEVSKTAAVAGRETTNTDVRSEGAIPIIEEELKVGKRTVQTGGVAIDAKMKSEKVSEDVNLRQENVDVEIRKVNRPVTDADVSAVKDGNIVVKEMGEEAVSAKEARVVGEVVVSKDVTERTETVSDTVRSTDVDIDKLSEEELRNKKR